MFNIGIASFSGTLSEAYLKRVNEIGKVHLIHPENIEQTIKEVDCIIIPDNSSNDNTMSITLKSILEIKALTNKLVWVLTNDMASIKNIVFLKLGVDGVLPVNDFPEEFMLVVKNALHRQINTFNYKTASQKHSVNALKRADDSGKITKVELLPSNLSVILDEGEEINLTRLEYRTFELLFKKRNKVVSYEEIYEAIWKDKLGNKQYRVANIIFHLRKKIELNTKDSQVIKTVRSIGYRLS